MWEKIMDHKKEFIDKLLFDYDLIDVDNNNGNRVESALLDATPYQSPETIQALEIVLAGLKTHINQRWGFYNQNSEYYKEITLLENPCKPY